MNGKNLNVYIVFYSFQTLDINDHWITFSGTTNQITIA